MQAWFKLLATYMSHHAAADGVEYRVELQGGSGGELTLTSASQVCDSYVRSRLPCWAARVFVLPEPAPALSEHAYLVRMMERNKEYAMGVD